MTRLPAEWHEPLQTFLLEEDPDAEIIYESESGAVETFLASSDILLGQALARDAVDANIYVCVVRSIRILQACAVRLDHKNYVIVMWMGAFWQIQSAISHLSQTNYIRKAFRLPLDGPDTQIDDLIEGDSYGAFQSLIRTPLPDIAEGPVRDFCVQAIIAANEFLVLHEVGHIVNGHLLLSKITSTGLRYVTEFQSDDLEDDATITSHTLEMDADAYAAQRTVQNQVHRGWPLVLTEEDRNAVERRRVAIFAFATSTLFRCMDDQPITGGNLWSYDHPTPLARVGMIQQLLEKLFIDSPHLSLVMSEIALLTEYAIFEATGVKNSFNQWEWLFNPTAERYRAYCLRLLSRWAKILPKLEPVKLTKFKLAPASQPAS